MGLLAAIQPPHVTQAILDCLELPSRAPPTAPAVPDAEEWASDFDAALGRQEFGSHRMHPAALVGDVRSGFGKSWLRAAERAAAAAGTPRLRSLQAEIPRGLVITGVPGPRHDMKDPLGVPIRPIRRPLSPVEHKARQILESLA